MIVINVTEANWQRKSLISSTTDYCTVQIWYRHSHVVHRKIILTIEGNKQRKKIKSQYCYMCDPDNCRHEEMPHEVSCYTINI